MFNYEKEKSIIHLKIWEKLEDKSDRNIMKIRR